ncbi:MAG TPA: Wzt carbohydrate-binding domain-containing protein, partial [Methanotrichaceae archaeon]|nr:Wzt carbohydrate-binding domain-containing protein [Methanotrichaceae archaeon]
YNTGENSSAQVGDKSGENTESDAAADAGGKKTRWGNGKVEITGVKLLDKNGRENSNFVFGDPLTVRIFYKANEPVESPVFGVVFYSQETYCYGTTNEFKGHDAGIVVGTGHLDLAINRLPLLAGRFEITVAVASSDYTTSYDWHDRLYSFHVHNPTRELGIFAMDGSWEMVRDEPSL